MRIFNHFLHYADHGSHAFRTGKAPVLISTSLAARGLDIKNVMHIINFDLPDTSHGGIDEYIHRIGRTARIGNRGQSSSFYNETNMDIAPALVKILMETNQVVPDFLQEFAPEDGEITWDDDTDDEQQSGNSGVKLDGDDDSWGAAASGSGKKDTGSGGWADSKATATETFDTNSDWQNSTSASASGW